MDYEEIHVEADRFWIRANLPGSDRYVETRPVYFEDLLKAMDVGDEHACLEAWQRIGSDILHVASDLRQAFIERYQHTLTILAAFSRK